MLEIAFHVFNNALKTFSPVGFTSGFFYYAQIYLKLIYQLCYMVLSCTQNSYGTILRTYFLILLNLSGKYC